MLPMHLWDHYSASQEAYPQQCSHSLATLLVVPAISFALLLTAASESLLDRRDRDLG